MILEYRYRFCLICIYFARHTRLRWHARTEVDVFVSKPVPFIGPKYVNVLKRGGETQNPVEEGRCSEGARMWWEGGRVEL